MNKTSTKATLRWNVVQSPSLREDVRGRFLARYARRITQGGEILVTSQRFRDRPRNVADCLDKLHAMLETVAAAPRRRRASLPGRGAVERRLEGKRRLRLKKEQRRRPQDG